MPLPAGGRFPPANPLKLAIITTIKIIPIVKNFSFSYECVHNNHKPGSLTTPLSKALKVSKQKGQAPFEPQGVNMYAILRLNKIKNRSQLAATQNHNLRLKPVSNCDASKSHLNRNSGASSYKELVAEIEDRFFQHSIKPRSDAVQAVEVVLSASPEFFADDNDMEKVRRWSNENYKFAKQEFGSNLLQFTLHLDEKTPHIHLIFTPITKDGRLSCKDMYGGSSKLTALQNRYAAAMSKFSLKRGMENSKAKHTSIKQFYTLIEKLRNLTDLQLKVIAAQLEKFDKQNNKTDTTINYQDVLQRIVQENTRLEQMKPKPRPKRKRA